MGRRGPRAQPTEVKKARGNPGKRGLPKDEPRPAIAVPEPPEELDDLARAEWDRVAPLLAEHRLLTLLDRAALAAYCQTYSDVFAAIALVRKHRTLRRDDKGNLKLNPAVKVVSEKMRLLRNFLAEFGMSPATRSSVAGAGGAGIGKQGGGLKAFAQKKTW